MTLACTDTECKMHCECRMAGEWGDNRAQACFKTTGPNVGIPLIQKHLLKEQPGSNPRNKGTTSVGRAGRRGQQ